jgi:hypothetical protein
MKFELKTLSREAVPRALAKAERYRLLHEPGEAASICHDALAIEPDNQAALAMLLLALTDQFEANAHPVIAEAWSTVERFADDYDRAYYTGIVHERRAKAQLRHGAPGSGPLVYGWLREAMTWYERAEAIRPAGNDDAILRWNACARLIMGDRQLAPAPAEVGEPLMLE